MAYSTKTQVKDLTITTALTNAAWIDGTLDARILEADTVIDGSLASMGYTVPFAATLPPLIVQLSILYSRYAVIRDIYSPDRAPSQASNQGSPGSQYKDQFDKLIQMLRDGEVLLVDSTGAEISRVSGGVRQAADGVEPIFTMTDPEYLSQTIPDEYTDDDIKGVP